MKTSAAKVRWLLAAGAAAGASILATAPAQAQLPAFSGADGAGAHATGGRGGIVYHVTRLDTKSSDAVPGTLRYGLSDSNFKDTSGNVIPRTIVFDVGGTIWLGRNPTDTEGWDTTDPISAGSNITLAGQTAPGGINIVGGGLKLNGNNTIVRNVLIAPGYGTRHANGLGTGYYDQYAFDGMNIHASNVMVDHVTTVFATDEGISADELGSDVTVQYSTIANGQNYPQQDAESSGVRFTGHALGSLWQPGSGAKTSLLHNLYANEAGRTPRFGTEAGKLTTPGVGAMNDFRNNVIYNWLNTGGTGASGQPSSDNFVGNYYRAGMGGEVPGTVTIDPNTGKYTVAIAHQDGGTGIFNGEDPAATTLYQSGNIKDLNKNATAEFATAIGTGDFPSSSFAPSPFAVPYYGVTDSAQVAYQRVLAYAGANWQSRSAIDSDIVNGVRSGAGQITALNDPTHGSDWNVLLNLRSSASGGIGGAGKYARPADFDSDGDGMPDIWEAAHALNPAVADNNADNDDDGYTNLEEYLNELAAFPAPEALNFTNSNGNQRYAQIGNWSTGVWQPSRFDTAQINSGNVIVDAPGQHAGNLKIAGSAGTAGFLTVNAGWIDVASDLVVADGGIGTVHQTGGIVHAGNSVILGAGAAPGSYTLSAGILSTPLLTRGPGGGTFILTGGTLHADHVTFSLSNQGGILSPGSDGALELIAAAAMPDEQGQLPSIPSLIGNTRIDGDLNLASGALQIDLASADNFDSIAVSGALQLGGDLDVQLLDGYAPSPGEHWLIGSAGAISGSFASITDGLAIRTTGGNLYLTAVPEPASIMLVSLSACAGLKRRRR
jgi:hypothetical protein